ncbi:PQQ-dependent sugar dehydrogenase [Roseomonas elaeocarpi]|uniref:PQQ-dependent sugar dehydrogenase n=1 Tax=Roseomonas elaeocarpi TaxID=907779 RepID=A0ABV6JXC3_9PROT
MARRRDVILGLAGGLATGRALAQSGPGDLPGMGPQPELPPPNTTHRVVNRSHGGGWPRGRVPKAPPGFTVTAFAEGLDNPRWVTPLPGGDVLVAEAPAANRVSLLRAPGPDGRSRGRVTILEGLNRPFGMALMGRTLFVADTDALLRFPWNDGNRITARGETLLRLPAGGYNNHWTRNILPARDGRSLFLTVGSGSNAAEHGLDNEIRRANILHVGLDGSGEQIFAAGLRNPVGLDWEPSSGALWTVVNERDNIGDDLVPDYLTRVQEGGFYGWPFSYFGQNPDPRLQGQRPDLVARAIVPDYALGPHTASLGLAFSTGRLFPDAYRGGAFIGQRGSWNRSAFSGYRVLYLPFRDSRPAGMAQDFLTGFMADPETGQTYGRPVGVAVDAAGALLVADDVSDTVWRVTPT